MSCIKKYLNGEVSYDSFKLYRNKLTSIYRERKKQYFANFCEKNRINTTLISPIWQQINQILGQDRSTVNNLNLNSDKINQFLLILGLRQLQTYRHRLFLSKNLFAR